MRRLYLIYFLLMQFFFHLFTNSLFGAHNHQQEDYFFIASPPTDTVESEKYFLQSLFHTWFLCDVLLSVYTYVPEDDELIISIKNEINQMIEIVSSKKDIKKESILELIDWLSAHSIMVRYDDIRGQLFKLKKLLNEL